MPCANCGAELLPGKRFCPACGHAAPRACPSCNATVDADFRFCPDCGAQLQVEEAPTPASTADDRLARLSRHIPADLAAKIRASKGTTAGERKLVTVMFCDLVGSTALAEQLDPEEYRDILDQYLELAFREIYRFEGNVNQLAGDGLMALFGAPVAHENTPRRAVLAALAIRDALGRFSDTLRRERGFGLRARIGIHSGPVVVGTVGNDLKMDYTAIGDTTNLASRLQSVADPDAILVSEATHRLVLGFFHVRSVGPFSVKGKTAPVAAYEVLGRRDSVTPMGIAVARGLTPLVGRREELAQLRSCFERLAGRMAQIVSIVGEDGSGKSRLLYEFKQQLAGESVVFLEGRCSSLTQMVPYAPFASMFRAYFGLKADTCSSEICGHIADKVRPVDPNLDRIYPYLCRLLAAPPQGGGEAPAGEVKRETLEAVARFVMGVSEQLPLVMIVEDIQWIDELSLELLDLAASRLHSARVMLVVSHRTDHEPAWRTQAAFTRLNLRRLSEGNTAEIVAALAGGPLPTELEQRILIKAEGNPFFTEELTRALVEAGDVVRGDDGVRLSRPVDEIPIPDTVQEVIGARLDRLGPHAKRVVQVASVLGRQFLGEELAQLVDEEGIDSARELKELEHRGIIHRKTVLTDTGFRFGESLTQQVAYESLLLRERRELHGRIARSLQAMPGEGTAERSALVAHHFAHSDDRGEAIRSLLRAASDAEEVPSYRTAVELYRQAWEMAEEEIAGTTDSEHPARRWCLRATAGLSRLTILYGSPAAADSERAASRGRELAEELGDSEALAHLCSLHGMHTMGGDRDGFGEGLAMIERGLAVAEQAQLTLPTISVSRGLALGYVLDGRFDAARDKIDWVMAELTRTGERERLSGVYFGACWVRDTVRLYSDDFAGALQGAMETYELSVRAHNRTSETGSAAKVAQLHLLRGDYAKAAEWADRCLAVAEQIDNVAAIVSGAAVALVARAELGETVAGTRHVPLLDHALTTGHHMLLNSRLVVEAFLVAGDSARAERASELAYQRAGGRLRETLSASALGDVAVNAGSRHWPDAAQWYERALSLAEAIGSRSGRAVATLGLAELAAAQGDYDDSTERLTRTIELCNEIGLVHYRTRTERLAARIPTTARRRA